MEKTVASLENKKNVERWKAAAELERFGQPAADSLITALKDEDRWVRYIAADALANIGAVHAIPALIALLDDPDQDVRFAVAAAIGKLGGSKALPQLTTMLKTDNGYVRIAVEEAIEKISQTKRD
jgi:HEAT repeat protein